MKLAILVTESFQRALITLNQAALPFKTAYELKGISKQINDHIYQYEAARTQSLMRYAKKNENGEFVMDENLNVLIDEDQRLAYFQDMEGVLNNEIPIQKITVKFDDLKDVKLSADDLTVLEHILEII